MTNKQPMDKQQILALFDQEQRIGTQEFGAVREETSDVIRYLNLNQHGAWITYSWLREDNIDRVIEDQIAYFSARGLRFEWKVYSYDWPPDLIQRLAARGFEIEEEEALCILDLEKARPELFAPLRHAIRQIDTPGELDAVMEVQHKVWGEEFDWLKEELASTMQHAPDLLRVYVAEVDGQAVSGAWIRFYQGSRFAGLFGGSTLPEYRGRGIYRDLVAVRAQEARRRGIRFLMVDASPMSRPILEKLGFEVLARTTPCVWGEKRV